MSETQQPSQLADALAEMMAREMGAIEDSREQFDEQMKTLAQQRNELVGDMMDNIRSRSKRKELPENIATIVAVLQAQPRLIPAVETFLQGKVAEINAALDSILGPTTPPPTEP